MRFAIVSLLVTVLALTGATACFAMGKKLSGDLGSCTPDNLSNARAGSICRTPTALWTIERNSYEGKPVFLDATLKMRVTAPLGGKTTQHTINIPFASPGAVERCSKQGFVLPTADDFTALEKDGIRQVVPGLPGELFWAATGGGDLSYTAYVGDNGGLASVNWYNALSVICVSSGRELK